MEEVPLTDGFAIELFPRHAWSLFARTNTFVDRVLLFLCPRKLRVQ
jgi:hypothetical protein